MAEDLKKNPHNKTTQLQCVTSWEQEGHQGRAILCQDPKDQKET